MARDLQVQAPALVYAGTSLSGEQLADLGTRAGGVVLRGSSGRKTARYLREVLRFEGPLMLDPALYEKPVTGPIAVLEHLESQIALSADWLLGPAPFVAEANVRLLKASIELGQRFVGAAAREAPERPAFAVLALHRTWLTTHRSQLIAATSYVDVPIALVLGDAADPLASRSAVAGLKTLLKEVPSVALLRTDLGGLGALAHGALLAAFGTGTSVRHVVPPGVNARSIPLDRTPSVLVRGFCRYLKGSTLETARGRHHGFFDCTCQVCGGESLTRFGDVRLTPEAHRHNAEVAYLMAEHIMGFRADLREANWNLTCSEAVDAHEALGEMTGIDFRPTPQLRAWAEWQ